MSLFVDLFSIFRNLSLGCVCACVCVSVSVCRAQAWLAGEEYMVYENTNGITASLQRVLLQGRPGSGLSLPKAFFPAFIWLPAS